MGLLRSPLWVPDIKIDARILPGHHMANNKAKIQKVRIMASQAQLAISMIAEYNAP